MTLMDVELIDPSVLLDMPLFAGVNVRPDAVVSWPQVKSGYVVASDYRVTVPAKPALL